MLSYLRGERPRALQARGFIRRGHGLSNFSCRVHRITAFPFIYQIVLMILITRVVSIIQKDSKRYFGGVSINSSDAAATHSVSEIGEDNKMSR